MLPTIKQARAIVGVALLTLIMALAAGPAAFAQGIDDEMCASCHPDVVEAFGKSAHGLYLSDHPDWANYTCESCHGSGVEHVEEGDPEKIINPANADQFGAMSLCLNCHESKHFDEWPFSSHFQADVNCADCHQVHVTYDEPTTAKPVVEQCYTCHEDVRAATFMPSHHPIAEGKMDCVDCHNPHGGNSTLALDMTSKELCYSCHADKEGPFVYEHAPVTEDCMICHTPHGSVANNLLKYNEPALCLNCHAMHFHATVEGIDGEFDVPLDPSRNSSSTPDGWKKAMLTKCTQCHTAIHGGDLPSQAISTGGNGLTR